MKIFAPKYYKEFRCIADACPDSCCKEWVVDVDAESAARYRSLSGQLGQRLRDVLKETPDGWVMTIENGRCPMWRQDSLCRIQAELGHDALCKTCRDFPRISHDYGDFKELGLELSCPEAARLILTSPNWCMEQTHTEGDEGRDYDVALMDILRQSRQEVLTFLENSPYPLPQTLAVILLSAHQVQSEIDGGEAVGFEAETLLAQINTFPKSKDLNALFGFFGNLEILTPRWKERLAQVPDKISWSPTCKAFARYLVQRYWLQAVSDYDLVCRVKLIIATCILVAALGGNTIQTAQLFSKEIENNPDNIEAILDGAYTSPALTDVNLFGLLLP